MSRPLRTDGSYLTPRLEHARVDDGEERLLRDVADRDLSMISSSEPLTTAAELMRDRRIAHLVVRDAQSGRPTGMLSTLDVAGILAWSEA